MAEYGHGNRELQPPGRQGKFGRMFERGAYGRSGDARLFDRLRKLAKTMVEKDVDGAASPFASNMHLPAGYAFLGQFIDHDLTFDPMSKLLGENDPSALANYRTPALDLDSVYGGGPEIAAHLYEKGRYGRFLIGCSADGVEDLPRNQEGIALLGDRRNDDNRILSQLHLVFLRFHNRTYDELSAVFGDPKRCFAESSMHVRFHYQWLVLTDFLKRIIKDEVLETMLPIDRMQRVSPEQWSPALRFFWRWGALPYIPVEFAAAAFRYGHSVLKNSYMLNKGSESIPLLAKSGKDLRGRCPLIRRLTIDWSYFFDTNSGTSVQAMRSIDTLVAAGLSGLPAEFVDGEPSLPLRTLWRGVALGLPTGQAVARAVGLPPERILSSQNRFSIGPQNYFVKDNGKEVADPSVPTEIISELKNELMAAFADATPLWYYVLKEAEVFEQGRNLGWVGSTIVAEVILGLLAADPASFLNASPQWCPLRGRFGCQRDRIYTMPDLLAYTD